MIDPEKITASLEADPFREDYPLAMLAEDCEREQDPRRRAAYMARMLERCQGTEIAVSAINGGAMLHVGVGDQRITVALPRALAKQVAIMLLQAMDQFVGAAP